MDDFLTVAQVATRLNTSVRFVRRLIEERRLPFHKLGRHVRIAAVDLDRYVAASRVESSHPAAAERRVA